MLLVLLRIEVLGLDRFLTVGLLWLTRAFGRSSPSGFAPAFGRAVGRFAARFRREAKASLYLEAFVGLKPHA
jgi:hypothetical protein